MNKRKISSLIPYKIKNEEILVYLQKRSKDMEKLPNFFGFWGGGAENNENPEEALQREIKEELDFIPNDYRHFGVYEFEGSIKNFFVIKVDDAFENSITVLEGDYGKWFNEEEVAKEQKLIEKDKIVLRDFYKKITKL